MFVGIPETEIRPVIVYQQFVRGVIGCEQEEVLAAGNLSQLADFRNQKMPEYDGSQFLSDTQLLPQRTAVIIGAEMHDFHTGKGFSPLFRLSSDSFSRSLMTWFFFICEILERSFLASPFRVRMLSRMESMVFLSSSVEDGSCSNSTRKRNSSLILRNFPPPRTPVLMK